MNDKLIIRHPSRRAFLSASIAAGATFAFPSIGRAQSFPSKPVRLILGVAPGGSTDALARLLATHLAEILGQPVVVENKSGANGNLATEAVAKSAPDGHTLLLSTGSQIVAAPHGGSKLPADPIKDLVHIAMVSEGDVVMVTNPALPSRTVEEFVAVAKRDPGKLIHATPGLGSTNHIGGELFAIRTGTSLKTVHYRGSGPIMTDLLANQVNMTIASVGTVEPHVKSGRLVALMMLSSQRSPLLPGVPCSAELKIKDLEQITFWTGLHAPKGTPDPVVRKLQKAFADVLARDAVRERMTATGIKPVGNSPEAFAARIDNDYRLYGEIFRTANIRIEQ